MKPPTPKLKPADAEAVRRYFRDRKLILGWIAKTKGQA